MLYQKFKKHREPRTAVVVLYSVVTGARLCLKKVYIEIIAHWQETRMVRDQRTLEKSVSLSGINDSPTGEDFGVPVLTIYHVDPCIEENGEKHRTSRYELMTRQVDGARLVVRRGQEFYLHLSLSRDYDSVIDGISIVFILDGVEKPQYGHGTLIATPLLNPGEISEAAWQTTIDAIEPSFLRIKAS